MIARRPGAGDDPPLPQHAVLEQEFIHLHGRLPDGYPLANQDADQRLVAIHAAIHDRAHAALCLSGGGIRSASFAVGVLQGLARRSLLPSFDFLSTVSGGGYTGAWFSAWLYHTIHEGGDAAAVFAQLSGGRATPDQPEPEPRPPDPRVQQLPGSEGRRVFRRRLDADRHGRAQPAAERRDPRFRC